jgi:hypothetical protein
MSVVTLDELKKTFNVEVSWPKTIAYVKTFKIRSYSDGTTYSGRLYWDANDGFSVYWEGDGAPAMAFEEDFLYTLDSYSTDTNFIPPYGDLSDAGMDGA